MGLLAGLMNRLFDLLCAPFGGAAAWAMAVLSVLLGALLLLLFKATTNQQALAAARGRLFGHLYELGLYQEDLRVMLRVQGDLAAANLRYLSRSLPAVLPLVVVVLLVLPQLQARWEHRPLRPGEAALVTATVAPGQEALLNELRLEAPAGVRVETVPVRDRQARTAQWRVRVERPGRHDLAVRAGSADAAGAVGAAWTKRLEAAGGLPRIAAVRERAGFKQALLNPAEAPLPKDAPLASIALGTAPRETRYAGVPMHWLVAFCLLSIVGGLALKPALKVEI